MPKQKNNFHKRVNTVKLLAYMKGFRQKHNLTQKAFSEKCGLSITTVNHIEMGKMSITGSSYKKFIFVFLARDPKITKDYFLNSYTDPTAYKEKTIFERLEALLKIRVCAVDWRNPLQKKYYLGYSSSDKELKVLENYGVYIRGVVYFTNPNLIYDIKKKFTDKEIQRLFFPEVLQKRNEVVILGKKHILTDEELFKVKAMMDKMEV